MFFLNGTETFKTYLAADTKEELLRKANEEFPSTIPANKDKDYSRSKLIDPIYPEPMTIKEIRC